jgi:pyruvate dehydrogenase E2 component (dihydrolipoyllysine-residue acetyltransferase)
MMALDKELVTVTPMRAAVARHMQASKQEVPHFYVSAELRVGAAVELAEALNGDGGGVRVSLSAVLVHACALALREHPQLNAVWTDDGLARAEQINVSVAVALEGGLLAPAILDADRLDLLATAEALSDLVARARSGKLRAAEMTDGTFTVSNLGMFGVSSFAAIITPPQVAVLATGKVERRPVWRDDELVPVSVLTATLSSDHRALDGADAARFLATVQTHLEAPPR